MDRVADKQQFIMRLLVAPLLLDHKLKFLCRFFALLLSGMSALFLSNFESNAEWHMTEHVCIPFLTQYLSEYKYC